MGRAWGIFFTSMQDTRNILGVRALGESCNFVLCCVIPH